ncbi:MAG: TolC family protein, partial [Methylovulum sp.]|nr:TolC family protein [Methylovulum sp.]
MKPYQRVLPISLLVTACSAVGPDYHPPTIATPKQWQTATPSTTATKQSDAWWQTFGDPELNQLINEAVASNLDLKIALLRIKDVRAQRVGIYASALPTLTARSSISRRLNNTSSGSSTAG